MLVAGSVVLSFSAAGGQVRDEEAAGIRARDHHGHRLTVVSSDRPRSFGGGLHSGSRPRGCGPMVRNWPTNGRAAVVEAVRHLDLGERGLLEVDDRRDRPVAKRARSRAPAAAGSGPADAAIADSQLGGASSHPDADLADRGAPRARCRCPGRR